MIWNFPITFFFLLFFILFLCSFFHRDDRGTYNTPINNFFLLKKTYFVYVLSLCKVNVRCALLIDGGKKKDFFFFFFNINLFLERWNRHGDEFAFFLSFWYFILMLHLNGSNRMKTRFNNGKITNNYQEIGTDGLCI